jgi:ATP-dependent DNA ligase
VEPTISWWAPTASARPCAGVSDFYRLRGALARLSDDAFMYVFDVLGIDCTDLRLLPWEQRRPRAEEARSAQPI